METTPVPRPQRRWLTIWIIYAGLTVVLGGLAYAGYGLARAHGIFSYEMTSGNWHPWWGSPYDVFSDRCLQGLALLAALSVLTGIGQGISRGSWRPLLIGLGLATLQVILFYGFLFVIYMHVG